MLKDRHVLILGLGASGLAMARWCARCGAQVTVADTREAPPQLAALREHSARREFVSGRWTASAGGRPDVRAVFRSPGLSPATVAPVAEAAGWNGPVGHGELGCLPRHW
jgi:UDP-N-acetylmuramoylalanine--D-glutamate ligase